jgi:VIT1/CCC1 family predicted Fe2+/Mn2+ transporter
MSTAPAAAAAVAVAWAASRRDDDVATTAAVAGIALALFGILMTLIYGTSSLTLVALGIIVAAAAAAWKKI